MGFGGALLAMSAVQGIASIGQGYAKSAEDKYNANLAGLQAQALGVQGDITQGQYTRKSGQMLSTQTATVAAAGLEPTGSYAAAMLDAQTQIHTDMAIAKYNTQMGINYKEAEAKQKRIQATQDVYSGYSNAFSEMLSGAAKYGQYSKSSFDLNSGASQALPESTLG
jgi:hypothetical protein